MPRLLLNDEHWSKLREILLHKAIYNKRDLRMTVEGMLYCMRTGCPWRDLPKAFGNWNKVYKRFNAWSAAGKWFKVFKMLVAEPDMEWVFIDGSYAKAHQHSAGAASANDEAIGKSRAGNIRDELQRRRHEPVRAQGQWLTRVVRGYFNYHAVPGNLIRLGGFRSAACRLWRQALKRRSQRNRLQWSRYGRLADLYIPRPRNAHPYPEDRFASHTRGRSRMR